MSNDIYINNLYAAAAEVKEEHACRRHTIHDCTHARTEARTHGNKKRLEPVHHRCFVDLPISQPYDNKTNGKMSIVEQVFWADSGR
jgi:hypothetical protein